DGVTRFICAQIITPRWYGAELTGKIAPCDRLHGNHRSKWNDHLAREAVMVLAPDLLNEAAAQNAVPAIKMLRRCPGQAFDQRVLIIMIDTQMQLCLGKRDRLDRWRRDQNGTVHRILVNLW